MHDREYQIGYPKIEDSHCEAQQEIESSIFLIWIASGIVEPCSLILCCLLHFSEN